MSTRERFTKTPDGVLDYKFAWAALTANLGSSDWLESGDTITEATVTVPAGLTKDSQVLDDNDTSVVVWLSGGTLNESYEVRCHITTEQGRQETKIITIAIVE